MVLDFGGNALFGRGGNEFFESQEDQSVRGKYITKENTSNLSGAEAFGYTKQGVDTNILGDARWVIGCLHVLNVPGSYDYMQMYATGSATGRLLQMGVYNWPGSALIQATGSSTPLAADPLTTGSFNTRISLNAGSYILAFGFTNISLVEYSDVLTTKQTGSFFGGAAGVPLQGFWGSGTQTPFNGSPTNTRMFSVFLLRSGLPATMTDTELFFNLESDSIYNFQMNLGFIAPSGPQSGLVHFSIPTSANGEYWMTGDPISIGSNTILPVGSVDTWYTLDGYVRTQRPAGKLELTWAKQSGTQNDIQLLKRSWATLTKN